MKIKVSALDMGLFHLCELFSCDLKYCAEEFSMFRKLYFLRLFPHTHH